MTYLHASYFSIILLWKNAETYHYFLSFFKYIIPAGGLLKSSPNTFVKIMLRKGNQKTRDFRSFIRGTLQGFFRLSDSFSSEGVFLIKVLFSKWIKGQEKLSFHSLSERSTCVLKNHNRFIISEYPFTSEHPFWFWILNIEYCKIIVGNYFSDNL